MRSPIEVFAERWGTNLEMMSGDPASHLSYAITGVPADAVESYDGRLDTLRLQFNGRWGNYVYQLIHMLHVAKIVGVTNITAISTAQAPLAQVTTIDGITISSHEQAGDEGVCLTGAFFNPAPFGPMMQSLTAARRTSLARTYIRPLMTGVGEADPHADPASLTISIRSGDIFVGDPVPTGGSGYTQPPLSFYREAIKAALPSGRGRIVIITEGALNPVVLPLIAELATANHEVVVRLNHDLDGDLAILMNSTKMVFGNGSFGIAAALLSSTLREGYFFRENGTGTRAPISVYLDDAIEKHIMIDEDGTYTPLGGWRNTDEQRQLMLDFPAEKLRWAPRNPASSLPE